MKRFLALSSAALLVFVVLVPLAEAHRNGCHRWHSCPSDTGSYVCGDWGYSNYCNNTGTSTGVTATGWAFTYWQVVRLSGGGVISVPARSMVYHTLPDCKVYAYRTARLGYQVSACSRV